jgi:hypothetical protein
MPCLLAFYKEFSTPKSARQTEAYRIQKPKNHITLLSKKPTHCFILSDFLGIKQEEFTNHFKLTDYVIRLFWYSLFTLKAEF